MMLAAPNIDMAYLLRCTRVSKEWHALIYDTNALRAKLFLTQRSGTGELVEVTDPRYLAPVKVTIVADVFTRDQSPCVEVKLQAPFPNVAVHPFLLQHRVVSEDNSVALTLSYQVSRVMFESRQKGSSSWKHMSITEPPLRRINLNKPAIQCVYAPELRDDTFDSTTGVTLEDLFLGLLNSTLPRNLGLISWNSCCTGYFWKGRHTCPCYNMLGNIEEREREEAEKKKANDEKTEGEKAEEWWMKRSGEQALQPKTSLRISACNDVGGFRHPMGTVDGGQTFKIPHSIRSGPGQPAISVPVQRPYFNITSLSRTVYGCTISFALPLLCLSIALLRRTLTLSLFPLLFLNRPPLRPLFLQDLNSL